MYEQFTFNARATLQPMLELVEVNARALEKLVAQQANYTVDLIKANVDHTRALTQSDDFESALETQQSFTKRLGEEFAEVAQKQLDVMMEAKDAAVEVFRTSLQPATPAKAKPAAKAVAKKAAAAEV